MEVPDITLIDNILSPEDIEYYISFIKTHKIKSGIVYAPEIAHSFWEKYKEKLSSYGIIDITPYVSVLQRDTPILLHVDPRHGAETHKLIIYLNDVSTGGTFFYSPKDNKNEYFVENKCNRAVLFDITLPHKSQLYHSSTIKYIIGFRCGLVRN